MKTLHSPLNAFALRDGSIGFCNGRVPHNAIRFARAPRGPLRLAVEVMARHAYDGKTLLVPGIPEAANEDAALLALSRFRREVMKRATDPDWFGWMTRHESQKATHE